MILYMAMVGILGLLWVITKGSPEAAIYFTGYCVLLGLGALIQSDKKER